jgi:hypothetical protein
MFEINWQERCKKLEEGIQHIKDQLENFRIGKEYGDDDETLENFVKKAYEECLNAESDSEMEKNQAESSEADKPFELEDVEVDIQEESESVEAVEDQSIEDDEQMEE